VRLDVRALPLSAPLRAALGEGPARRLALTGGEDYELCFTVPEARIAQFEAHCPAAQFGWTRIGILTSAGGPQVYDGPSVMQVSHRGFDHFG
jgi:thiamine-monophosphate kinase